MSPTNENINQSRNIQSEKYASEMKPILEEFQNDANIVKAIDKIIEDTSNVGEMQGKLIILIKKYLEIEEKKISKINKINNKKNAAKDKALIQKELERDIARFTRNIIKRHDSIDMEKDISDEQNYVMSKEARTAIKKTLKEFAVYEVYKAMNPKRIAGETKKDNYAHNMMLLGEKKAIKYEGGKEEDLKSYGKAKVSKIKKASKLFKKNNNGRIL